MRIVITRYDENISEYDHVSSVTQSYKSNEMLVRCKDYSILLDLTKIKFISIL